MHVFNVFLCIMQINFKVSKYQVIYKRIQFMDLLSILPD